MAGGCSNSAVPSTTPAAAVSKTSTLALSTSSVPLTTSAAAPPAPAPVASQPPPPAASQPAASPKPPAPGSYTPPAGGGAAPAPGGGASPVPLPPMSGKMIVTSSVVKDGGILKDPYAYNGSSGGTDEDTVDHKVGTVGVNDHTANAHQLLCGGGTGTFNYTVIVYALSKMLDKLNDPKAADATALRDAITGSILDAGSMTFDVILQ